MKWTTDMPSASGAYWVERAGKEPYLVQVTVGLSARALAVCYFGTADSGQLESYVGDKWYGPITPPSDELPAIGELIAVQRDAQRLRNALREVVKDMRARAAWIGPMSALWRDVFEYEMLINGRGDTEFDWDGPDDPVSRTPSKNQL